VTAVSPSVVQIRTPEDFGSGVVVDDRGDVVTNAYVVGNATRFVVTLASGAAKRVQRLTREHRLLPPKRSQGQRRRPATSRSRSPMSCGIWT